MRTENLIPLLQTGLKTIGVVFPNTSKHYTYKTLDTFKVGDKAIVEVSGELRIVDVVAIHKVPRIDTKSTYPYKWVVQRVDLDHYRAIREAEEAFVQELEDLGVIKAQESVLTILKEIHPAGSSTGTMLEAAVASLNEAIKK